MSCLSSLLRKGLELVHLQCVDSDFVCLFAAIHQGMIPILIFPFQSQVIKKSIISIYGRFQENSGGLETCFHRALICFAMLLHSERSYPHFFPCKKPENSQLENSTTQLLNYSPHLHGANMTQQKRVGEVLPVSFTLNLAVIRGTKWLYTLMLWTLRLWLGH